MNRVQRARHQVKAAQKELEAAMVAMFQSGTRAQYWLGNHLIGCEVLQVAYDRVRVINARGRTYWVNGFRFVGSGAP